VTPAQATPRATRLRGLFVDSGDFYALSDLTTAKRIGAFAWAVGFVIVLLLLPFATPTRHVGDAGWLLAGGALLASLVMGARLLRWPAAVTPNELMLQSYVALAQIAMLQWLGGRHSPYVELFLITAVYTAAVHPPRRVAPYLIALGLAALAPLAYDGWDRLVALDIATHILLWTALCAMAALFTATVRLNRQGLVREEEASRQLARVDPLTALGNRRAFDETLTRALSGARSSDRPFTILVADLARFKAVNDRFGHLEGDRCLREVGDALRATVRGPDACFRWGGDEFALVLPATNLAAARKVGDRLQETIEGNVTLPDGAPLRVRWGAAEYEDGMDFNALLEAADIALRAAKGPPAQGGTAAEGQRA
jgi:diguanylate cyclase (GGDEF)-like protein